MKYVEDTSVEFKKVKFKKSDIWIDGEPTESGYYLVLVLGNGNPWVFLAQVAIGIDRMPIYTDHYAGNDRFRQYKGGEVTAHCKPTGENFSKAFEEIKSFYSELLRRIQNQ